MTDDILLPFARLISNGLIVAPSEVPRGIACACMCPFCSEPVEAKKGKVNRHHFSHAKKHETPCPVSFERAILWMSERIIKEASAITTPDYVIPAPRNTQRFNSPQNAMVTEGRVVKYHNAIAFPLSHPEGALGQIDINLFVESAKLGISLGFNPSLSQSAFEPRQARIGIDLSFSRALYETSKDNFLDALKEAILQDTTFKTWLYHPREEVTRYRLAQECLGDSAGEREVELNTWADYETAAEAAQHAPPQKQNALPRAKALAKVAEDMLNAGHRWGYQCQSCYIMQPGPRSECHYCNGQTFKTHRLRTELLLNFVENAQSSGISERSISALPHLDYPIRLPDGDPN